MKFRRSIRDMASGIGLSALVSTAIILSGCSRKSIEPVAETPASDAKSEDSAKSGIDYNVPFMQAVTQDLRNDQLLPPDVTITGKPTAILRETVEKNWPKIQLTDSAGKPIAYAVKIETTEGLAEITLNPDWAPNHTRNFLALIVSGYYDGLKFDRVIHQDAIGEDGKKFPIDLLKAGCPAGTGDPGIGHLGYHLKPEFSQTIKHEAGIVGFTRDADPSSAGVRFYISLGEAPALDGNFSLIGKVTKGMDVLKKIGDAKLLPPNLDPTREFPEKPVAMTKVTVTPDPTSPNGGDSAAKSLK